MHFILLIHLYPQLIYLFIFLEQLHITFIIRLSTVLVPVWQ